MATPKLRFKEFDGDWTSKQLGKIIGVSSASRVFKEQWQDSGVPFFRTSDVVSIFKNKENEKAYISLELFEELAKKSGKIKQGDLLVTGGGTIGIPYLVPNDQPLYFKDADLLWMKSSGIVEGSFLYNFFISPKFREYLKSISHTGTISHFTIEQAKATPFGFPSKEEQTKIASFLSNVDEKISQLTQKHELLSQYKQGMMQKLFSQQIRFKADDGSEFGEWEETELGKHCQIKTGKLDANAMRPNGEFRFYTCAKEFYLIDEYAFDTEALLISGNGANVGYIHYYKGKFNAYQRTYVLDQWQQNIIFIQYFLEQFLKERIYGEKKEGNTPYIVLSTLSEMPLLLPCLEEQTKIAKFLSAIDQKIEVVAQQIEQAKQWKKGLLQQMFI